MEKRRQELVINTSERKYLLDGKDISAHLVSVNAQISGYEKRIELTFARPDVVISGMFVENLYPIVCGCGHRISNAATDCSCCCPKCGKQVIFQGGQPLSC